MTFDEWRKRMEKYVNTNEFWLWAETVWFDSAQQEREACAKVCEDLAELYGNTRPAHALMVAADRMRANTKSTGA